MIFSEATKMNANIPIPVRYFTLDERLRESFSNDYRTEPRPLGSLAYVEAGVGEYLTEGRRFVLEPGDLLFIPGGGTYVSYWRPAPMMLAMQFRLARQPRIRYPVQKLSSIEGDREDFFRALDFENTGDFGRLEIFYRVCGRHFHELETVGSSSDDRIRPAIERIELEVERPMTVAELASLCHMSESHFYAIFRKSTGMSPIDYRRGQLVMQAERLLTLTELPIGEIAAKLGFESETYFRRVFKASLGVSPRDYRNAGAHL